MCSGKSLCNVKTLYTVQPWKVHSLAAVQFFDWATAYPLCYILEENFITLNFLHMWWVALIFIIMLLQFLYLLPLVICFFKFHGDFQTITQHINETSRSFFNSYSSFALGYSWVSNRSLGTGLLFFLSWLCFPHRNFISIFLFLFWRPLLFCSPLCYHRTRTTIIIIIIIIIFFSLDFHPNDENFL